MYIKLNNGVPEIYTIGQLRKDNPNTSFPRRIPDDTLASFDVYPFVREDLPAYDKATQNVELGDIVNVNGVWTHKWNIVDKTVEEQQQYQQRLKSSYEDAVQRHLDTVAKEKGYDNIISACSYAGTTNAFQAEAVAALEWRSAVWTYVITVWADVGAGTRPQPTVEELINELPVITWPS